MCMEKNPKNWVPKIELTVFFGPADDAINNLIVNVSEPTKAKTNRMVVGQIVVRRLVRYFLSLL